MRIAVDVMGGDRGCGVAVGGVKLALREYSHISEALLVGREEDIQSALREQGCDDSRITVCPASQVLTMEDKPRDALRNKKDCSVVRAIELVKDGKADAVVSPGNTGGLMMVAMIKLRPLQQVERAALAAVMPSKDREFILLDAGANAECKPIHLAQFAVMGSVYSREILGRDKPRVGVLCNGSEDSKGNELTRETSRLCREIDVNFIGNIEGHDLFADRVEVVVTDGFMGNIVLKSCESLGKAIKQTLKDSFQSSAMSKLGALLASGAIGKIKQRFDADAYGGAQLLGLNGTVVKAHGSSSEFAIMNAIRVAAEFAQHKINETIASEVSAANEQIAKLKVADSPAEK
jgi:glycerol-3-phosphate acyltransferase PlsX